MPVLARLFKRQLFHYLKRLDLRLQIELVILFIIFIVFFTEKSIELLKLLLQKPGTSPIGITVFIEHIFFIPLTLTTPFIYTHLLPRQRIILALRLQPLGSMDVFMLMFLNYLKYETLVFILLLPLFGAIIFSLNILYLLHLIFIIFCILFILFTLMHVLAHKEHNKRILSYGVYFTTIFIYFILFYFIYTTSGFYLIFQAGVMLTALIIFGIYWVQVWKYWDHDLYRIKVTSHKHVSSQSYRNWYRIIPFASSTFYALTIKEILGYIRNSHFLRLKFTGIAIYLIILIVAQQAENYIAATSFVTIIYLWIHYTHQFNDKYVLPESAFFLKTFPFRYIQIWVAKFATEILFLLPIFIILISTLLISGLTFINTLYVFSTAFIFALFISATIISVKLLFFDNPRKAGYAYNFMVVFSLVMIYNFYLVGPVIILFTLSYLCFLSYRQFAR